MDLEVVGRHALLFDDDAMAVFVNSTDALLQWNSLLIDRYDVRHLLQELPPRARKRSVPPIVEPDGVSRIDLNNERYIDLPPEEEGDVASASEQPVASAAEAYSAVGFSYENMGICADHKNFDASFGNSDFHPPFPVPESLQKSIPPTEKLHQIIARTAKFVSEHGGQSEIVLRVKQGDNPTFGFLMPDHHLHPYFRFLVDHREFLQSDTNLKPKEEKNGGGALSLLGSAYGEDDDGPDEPAKEATDHFVESMNDKMHTSEKLETPNSSMGVDKATLKGTSGSAYDRSSLSKRKQSVSTLSSGAKNVVKKRDRENFGSLGITVGKQQPSLVPSTLETEPFVLEPPSSVKRMVDKIVDFVLRNGKESEAILLEQDSTSEKFPFLLPQNQYYPYYIKTLQKAQEAKLPKKMIAAVKHDSQETAGYKLMRENKFEGIYDTQRKEKFKMVIGGSKKGSQEAQSKSVEQHSGVSADAAAAIVMAATRGIRNPKLDSVSTSSPNDSVSVFGVGEGGPATSFGSISFSHLPNSSMSRPFSNGEMPSDLLRSTGLFDKSGNTSGDVSLGKAMAKSAALAAASEADSSEASMTKEQKQKAERLKRAKMFAAMIKSGAHPIREPLPQFSVSAPDSAISGCKSASNHSGLVDMVEREREGSCAPVDVDKFKGIVEKSKREGDDSDTGHLRKKHSSKVGKPEDDSDRDHKSPSNKHRSDHSSDKENDYHKHRKRHRESRAKFEVHNSSDDEEHRHRRSHKHHHTSKDGQRHRIRHHRPHSPSEDEHQHRSSRSHKHKKRLNAERVPVTDDNAKELETENKNKVGFSESSNSLPQGSKPSDETEIPDELRAKVRAMLLATL